MTSSRECPPARSRARRGPSRTATRTARSRAAYDDAYLDGLYTYCLSVMCEHDAASAALGEALALAERQHQHHRRPPAAEVQRSWLYSLARWVCLRRLTEQRERDGRGGALPVVPRAGGPDSEQRRRELAALAWPEAAGTAPEQREALELAVRHQLSVAEVARVLRLSPEAAHTLLTSAACEVERARGALAAVQAGSCPVVGVLAGEDRLLMAPGLRRELIRHVDECQVCRRTAQRALAGNGWPGTVPNGAERLVVLPVPRESVQAAKLAVLRARAQHVPKFDRASFPLDEKDRVARRERLRSRAVTTTVVATVLAAPVLALWAAYRGAPVTGEAQGGPPAATEDDRGGEPGYEYPYENAGTSEDAAQTDEQNGGGAPRGTAEEDEEPGEGDRRDEDRDQASPSPTDDPSRPGAGRLAVEAVATPAGTQITLRNTGDSAVDWRAASQASWLRLSQSSGTLGPGETATLLVTVDRSREPAGPWQGRIAIGPSGAVVTVEGHGRSGQDPSDPDPTDPDPGPTDPDPTDPDPSEPDPTDPDPGPTDPDPADPEPSDPAPEPQRR